MSTPEREQSLSKFMEITQMDRVIATKLMDESDWNIDIAVQHFFTMKDVQKIVPESVATGETPQAVEQSKKSKRKTASSNQRIKTIGSMRTDNSSGEDDEGVEAYYQGGSKNSGQQVIGKPKNKDNNIVEHMFKSAKQNGALEASAASTSETGRPGNIISFSGSGYRLSDTATPSGETSSPSIKGIMNKKKAKVSVTLKLWKKSFSLNDGPERLFTDPQNREFLQSIEKGEIPDELFEEHNGVEIDLNMVDLRNQLYEVPKKKLISFSGKGHSLSDVPSTSASISPSTTVANNNEAGENSLQIARQQFPVHNNSSTTVLQIRLADGSSLREVFNQSRTIQDIIEFIKLAQPQYSSADMLLMTVHPRIELNILSETLADAKLLNSVVIQRIPPKAK